MREKLSETERVYSKDSRGTKVQELEAFMRQLGQKLNKVQGFLVKLAREYELQDPDFEELREINFREMAS